MISMAWLDIAFQWRISRLSFLRLQGGVWMVPTHCNLQELQHLGGHELADQRKLYQIAGRNERKALVPGAQGPVRGQTAGARSAPKTGDGLTSSMRHVVHHDGLTS